MCGGRSPYGERGLKWLRAWNKPCTRGRSPYGERGLKYIDYWFGAPRCRRSPYGERGLKWLSGVANAVLDRRSPYGERGLKLPVWGYEGERMESLSLRRAWIEISAVRWVASIHQVALLTESADWNKSCSNSQKGAPGRSPYGERGL